MPVGPGARARTSGAIELASATLKTGDSRDLSIRFTSECFVYTQNANPEGQNTGKCEASATTWVEVDGKPVPVTASTPPDDGQIGLCSRSQELSAALSDLARNAGLHITLSAAPDLNLPTTLATVAYRVVHEALNNTVQHAGAQNVEVRPWLRSDRLQCAVRDDGVGFDLAQRRKRIATGGLGLIGMRERVHALQGRLDLWSAPGRGTIVRFSLPRTQPLQTA